MGKVESWVSSRGAVELSSHYARSARLHVNASPTLFVNNSPYEGKISKMELGKIQCSSDPSSSKLCDSLPECFADNDCRKKGMIGRCNSGNCEFRDAAPFSFTVLIADSTFQHPETDIIKTTQELFPGASVKVVSLNSKKGGELVKKYKPVITSFLSLW